MKPFEELTERGQGNAQLSFVACSENAVFRVETPFEKVAEETRRVKVQCSCDTMPSSSAKRRGGTICTPQ
jgi:hypothetical protein